MSGATIYFAIDGEIDSPLQRHRSGIGRHLGRRGFLGADESVGVKIGSTCNEEGACFKSGECRRVDTPARGGALAHLRFGPDASAGGHEAGRPFSSRSC